MVTVMQSGGDYSTLLAAVVANESTITIEGEWTIKDDPGANVMVIDAANPTTIEAIGASKHIGRAHDGVETTYRYRKESNGGPAFQLTDDLVLTGVDLRSISTPIIILTDQTFTGESSIFASTAPASQGVIDWNSLADAKMFFTNCAFYSCKFVASHGGTADGVVSLISCVGFDVTDTSIDLFNDVVGMTVLLQDTGLQTDLTTDPVVGGMGVNTTLTIDRCKTNADAWADAGAPTITNSQLEIVFTDTASPGVGDFWICNDVTTSPYDLRLQDSADNDAQDAHSETAGRPTVDIIGTSRPQGGSFDLGPFEILVATLPPAYGGTYMSGVLPPAYGVAGGAVLPTAYAPEAL